MTRRELASNFSINIEKERINQGYTQEQMARKLELSLSGYKRIINGDTTKIDLFTAYKAYVISNKLAYEFIGYSDKLVDTISKLKYLDSKGLALVSDMVDYMLDGDKANE